MTIVKFAYTAVVTATLGIHSPALGEGATAPLFNTRVPKRLTWSLTDAVRRVVPT